LPVYKCPKCGRQVELPDGTYYCKVCGPTAMLVPATTASSSAEVLPSPFMPYERVIYRTWRMYVYARDYGEYKIRVDLDEKEMEFEWGWQKHTTWEYGACTLRLPKTLGRKAQVRYWLSGGEEEIEGSYGRVHKTVWVDYEWARRFYDEFLEKIRKVPDKSEEVKNLLIEAIKRIAEKVGEHLKAWVETAAWY